MIKHIGKEYLFERINELNVYAIAEVAIEMAIDRKLKEICGFGLKNSRS